jgi:WD40 repeat protein
MTSKSWLLIYFTFFLLDLNQGFGQDSSIVYLNSKSKYINCLCFSKGGSEIAYSDGNNIQIRKVADTSLLAILENGHSDRVLALDISGDSLKVVSGGRDSLILLWDNKGNIIEKLTYHTGKVTAVKFDPTGTLIYSGSTDQRLICYSLKKSRVIFDKKVHTNDILSIDISPDGRLLASGGADGTVYILDTRNGDVLNNLGNRNKWIRSVKFSSDATTLATGSDEGSLSFWRTTDPLNIKAITKRKKYRSWVTGIDFFPDNTSYIYSNENGTIAISMAGTEYHFKIKQPIRNLQIQPGNRTYFNIGVATYGDGIMLIKGSAIMK